METKSYLSFKLGNELFAAEVTQILEVLQKQQITQVPQTPDFIKGVINFRGDIIPVIETRTKFRMSPREDQEKYVIIVIELMIKDKKMILGAVADGVRDVLDVKTSDIKPAPEFGNNYNTKFITGMLKTPQGFIMILNLDEVFSTEEVELISKTSENELAKIT